MIKLTQSDIYDIETSFLMISPLKIRDSMKGTQKDFGCGCLFEPQKSKRYLLSVRHLNVENMVLGVLGKYDINLKQPLYYTSPFNFFEQLRISQNGFIEPLGKDIDFIWRKVDPSEEYIYTTFANNDQSSVVATGKMRSFTSIVEPLLDDDYMFGGPVECGFDFERKAVTGERVYYSCEYLAEEDNYYFSFQLDDEVDQSQLKGLSGTPIFNRKHELVSLVVGGYEKGNVIKGINLWKLLQLIKLIEEV